MWPWLGKDFSYDTNQKCTNHRRTDFIFFFFNFCSSENTAKRMKTRQATDWDKIFVNHKFHKDLYPEYTKEISKLINKISNPTF